MIITDLRTYHVYGSREDQISPFFDLPFVYTCTSYFGSFQTISSNLKCQKGFSNFFSHAFFFCKPKKKKIYTNKKLIHTSKTTYFKIKYLLLIGLIL